MAYKQQIFTSHSSGGGEVQDQALANWLSGECALPGSRTAFFPPTVSSQGGRGEGALRGFYYKGVNAIHEGRAPRRPHLLIPSHWGLGFQHMNFGGTQTFSL